VLNPPRPAISWKDITQYAFLGEFDLLQHTWDDVRECLWARPAVREATAKFFKFCRAKEEITRLNVEIRRLRTAMHNEEREVSQAIANLCELQPLLACELERLHRPRTAVNAVHIHRLHQIEKQYGLVQMCIGTSRHVYYSNGEGLLPLDPDSQNEDGDARSMPADFQEERVAGEFHIFYAFCLMYFLEPSTNFDEVYRLYINDLGDHDLLDDEEDVAGLESMADFLHNIV